MTVYTKTTSFSDTVASASMLRPVMPPVRGDSDEALKVIGWQIFRGILCRQRMCGGCQVVIHGSHPA